MKTILTLIRKDILLFSRDRIAVVLTFAVPMILILIFGMAFSGGNAGPSGVRLLVVNEAGSTPLAEGLINALKGESTFQVITERRLADGSSEPLSSERVQYLLQSNPSTFRYALILPATLRAEGFGLNVELLYNPQNAIENGIVQGILRKTFFSNAFPLLLDEVSTQLGGDVVDGFEAGLADLISSSFAVPRDVLEGSVFFPSANRSSEERSDSSDFLDGLIRVEGTQVFGRGRNPASQSVVGFAVMFLLFSLSGAASSLFEERDKHIFQRLLSGGVTRSDVLISKFIFCSLLGLTQMGVLLVFGHLVFDVIANYSQIIPLAVIAVCSSLAATAFGMLLATLARTAASANGLGTLLILSMSALGGAMFPLFMMPAFMQDFVAPLTLVYWAVDGMLGVLWRDEGIIELRKHIAILLGIAGLILSVAWRGFQRSKLFS